MSERHFKISGFAKHWRGVFEEPLSKHYDADTQFADDCFALGFQMDCGTAFQEAYPNARAFESAENLQAIIQSVHDVDLLGSAIFSHWRYLTHWAYECDLMSPENRKWFVVAFNRMIELTKEGSEQETRKRLD